MLELARIQTLLYQGDAPGARQALLAAWPRLEGEQLLKLSFIRDELLGLRARTALALAAVNLLESPERAPGLPTAPGTRALLADARRCGDRLRRHGLAVGKAWAALIDAGLAQLRGSPGERAPHLRLAQYLFEGQHMALWAGATGCVLAAVAGDGEACGRGLAALRAQGVQAPARLMRLLLPAVCPEELLAQAPAPEAEVPGERALLEVPVSPAAAVRVQ
jgi:hypothetical protein